MTRFWIESDPQTSLKEVHGPFFPSKVFPGMGISVSIEFDEQWTEMRVWRLSPHGIELEIPQSRSFELGQPLFFHLKLGSQSVRYHGHVTYPRKAESGRFLVGVQHQHRLRSERPSNARREARIEERWQADFAFYPIAMAKSSLTFEDTVFFYARDVSSRGLRLQTSMRNKFLIPGSRWSARLTFPQGPATNVTLLIRNAAVIEDGGRTVQELGVQVLEFDDHYKAAMGQYIMRFALGAELLTPAEIYRQDLKLAKVEGLLDWGYVESAADYEAVQKLRKIGHQNLTASWYEKEASLDAQSRIIVAKYRGKVVASQRMTFASDFNSDQKEMNKTSLGKSIAYLNSSCIEQSFLHLGLEIQMLRFAISILKQARFEKCFLVGRDLFEASFLRRLGFHRVSRKELKLQSLSLLEDAEYVAKKEDLKQEGLTAFGRVYRSFGWR